ncbi:MAG TPA: hypothetical protein VLT88_09035, partial [Desulfosarcina sp.]|nr:hypothetical protein [Desulfosarcina sp.]
MHSNHMKIIIWVGVWVFFLSPAVWSQSPMRSQAVQKEAASEAGELAALSEDLTPSQIDRIVAGLSDEQVRRLLIEELKLRAEEEKGDAGKPEGMAAWIDRIKNLTLRFQERIELLRSGGIDDSRRVSGIYALLGTGERGTKSVAGVILSVAAVLAGGVLIQWLYACYTAPAYRRIASTVPSGWGGRIGALGARAVMDIMAILVLIVAVLILFFLFLDRTAGQRVLLAAYLTALICVQAAYVLSRFFLSPREPALRILPFEDRAAAYLHHWLLPLVFVLSFASVTTGVIRLAGAPELAVLKAGLAGGVIAAGMMVLMILQKRNAVAVAFSRGLPESSLRYRLAQKWHHFAVFGVLLLLTSATLSAVLGTSTGQAKWTLLMVVLYFLMDWLLRLMLEAAFGIVEKPPASSLPKAAQPVDSKEFSELDGGPPAAEETAADQPSPAGRLDLERMKGPLRTALRLALATLVSFWILKIWGVEVSIGEAVVKTIVEILVVVSICYIAYSLANAAIMRRLKQEMPQGENEEAEEGGGGGSRIGTLLMLLRKFMLVVIIVMAVLIILSTLGVNIGPLIAGAGVFGLALGLGTQKLVTDVVSGVFFLIDDAFS